MDVKLVSIYLACIIGILLIGRIFIVPIKIIIKLVLNSILGAILLFIINIVGSNFSFHIGINLITTLLTGILGIPGVVLLIILQIFLFLYFKFRYFLERIRNVIHKINKFI